MCNYSSSFIFFQHLSQWSQFIFIPIESWVHTSAAWSCLTYISIVLKFVTTYISSYLSNLPTCLPAYLTTYLSIYSLVYLLTCSLPAPITRFYHTFQPPTKRIPLHSSTGVDLLPVPPTPTPTRLKASAHTPSLLTPYPLTSTLESPTLSSSPSLNVHSTPTPRPFDRVIYSP